MGQWGLLDERKFPPVARDLIVKMLNRDPLQRPSISEVANHPFFASSRMQHEAQRAHVPDPVIAALQRKQLMIERKKQMEAENK